MISVKYFFIFLLKISGNVKKQLSETIYRVKELRNEIEFGTYTIWKCEGKMTEESRN